MRCRRKAGFADPNARAEEEELPEGLRDAAERGATDQIRIETEIRLTRFERSANRAIGRPIDV
jgi:hypothetical protein